MTPLVMATRNAHKARELCRMLGGDFRALSLADFPGAPAVVEDAGTFAGNAAKKALGLAHWLAEHPELPAAAKVADGPFFILADDSGLEVDALDGAPGVHSARFAAAGAVGNASDTANNAKLLRLLENVSDSQRKARFRCILALIPMDDSTRPKARLAISEPPSLFEGVCHGRISRNASGRGGFGYDPLFIPDGHNESFAELGDDAKNKISHRARAVAKLRQFLIRSI